MARTPKSSIQRRRAEAMRRRQWRKEPKFVAIRASSSPAADLRNVPLPPREYRLDLRLRPEIRPGRPAKGGFESVEAVRAEDELRAGKLIEHIPSLPAALRAKAQGLADRLTASLDDDALEPSLASAQFMREVRLRLLSELLRLTELTGSAARAVTIIPGWTCSPEELLSFDPRQHLLQLRARVTRQLGPRPKGFLRGYLHGEFDPASENFDIHFHGIASGDYLQAIVKLRKASKSPSVRNSALRKSGAHRPIQLRRLNDPARQVAYRLQSYWPTKFRSGAVSQKNSSKRGRIQGASHSILLLWFDNLRLSHLHLNMGSAQI